MSPRQVKIFTFGYSGASLFDLTCLSERFDATVIDTRYSRRTRNVQFSVKRLAAGLKDHYVHFREFGNLNYKNGGPIKLADPDLGIAKATPILRSRSVILLCVCRSPERCHRSLVARLLAEASGLPIKHLTCDDVV